MVERSDRGRRVRDEGDARELLLQIRSAGLALQPWCEAHGVNPWSLYWWRAKLHGQDMGRKTERAASLPVFTEVVVPPASPSRPHSAAASRYEVVLPNGPVVRLDADFDDAVLRRLLVVVSSC